MTAGMTFTPVLPPPTALDYLVVAGGGGGGRYYGGGGGAGGLLTSTGYSVVSNATYTVTVGTGGPGAPSTGIGTAGTNSIVSSNNSYTFNGSSQYLNVASNSAFNFGTGDFTIEMWVYITAGSTYQFLAGNDVNASSYLMLGINVPVSGTQTIAVGRAGVDWPLQFGSAITFASNTWYHVAVTRSGTTNKAFINGVQLGSNITDSTNWSMSNPRIGSQTGGTNFGGNISNVRLVKGISVYTGNFTVPTSPLTATQSAGTNISAITGVQTSLLTLQNATIIDNSSYGFAITNTGGVAFSSITPFTINSVGGGYGGGNSSASAGGPGGSGGGAGGPSSASGGAGTAGQGNNGGTNTSGGGAGGGGAGAAGGTSSTSSAGTGGVGLASTIIPNYSVSFNGSSQYLTVPSSSATTFSADFTIEGWIYPIALSGYVTVINKLATDVLGPWNIQFFGTTLQVYASSGPTWDIAGGLGTIAVSLNTWTHFAFTRYGNVYTLWVNGVASFTNTVALTPMVNSSAVGIGSYSGSNYRNFNGYISNIRLVNGTALYTSKFPVPTPPLLAVTNTSLLTAQSSIIVDNSTNASTITAIGSPTVSSTVIPTAYYSGGGGGSAGLGVLTNGGAGGGGSGATDTAGSFASAGAANTGGGGGGGSNPNSDPTWAGKSGGSGIAIIRYQSIYAQATTTGSPTFTSTGGYNIYTWTSSGSFSFSAIPTPTVEYLVVAGGGGGGTMIGGGGGAGGFRTATGFSVTSGTAYTVTVGTGGPGTATRGNSGTNGTDSVFSTITSTGGGGGASLTGTNTLTTPGNGGSGGGASGNPLASASSAGAGNTPSTSPSQGNNGGLGQTASPYGGGGGGGATAIGNVPSGTVGGIGGAGTASSISGSSVTYAGGGGGAPTSSVGATGGAGGSGGGGNGGSYSPLVAATNGTANTGGGGGGGSNDGAVAYMSGSGGSGIVIISYDAAYSAAASTTGSPSITTSGGYRIYTWTSSGSITF